MFGNDVNIYAVINFNAYSPVKHAVIDFTAYQQGFSMFNMT